MRGTVLVAALLVAVHCVFVVADDGSEVRSCAAAIQRGLAVPVVDESAAEEAERDALGRMDGVQGLIGDARDGIASETDSCQSEHLSSSDKEELVDQLIAGFQASQAASARRSQAVTPTDTAVAESTYSRAASRQVLAFRALKQREAQLEQCVQQSVASPKRKLAAYYKDLYSTMQKRDAARASMAQAQVAQRCASRAGDAIETDLSNATTSDVAAVTAASSRICTRSCSDGVDGFRLPLDAEQCAAFCASASSAVGRTAEDDLEAALLLMCSQYPSAASIVNELTAGPTVLLAKFCPNSSVSDQDIAAALHLTPTLSPASDSMPTTPSATFMKVVSSCFEVCHADGKLRGNCYVHCVHAHGFDMEGRPIDAGATGAATGDATGAATGAATGTATGSSAAGASAPPPSTEAATGPSAAAPGDKINFDNTGSTGVFSQGKDLTTISRTLPARCWHQCNTTGQLDEPCFSECMQQRS